MPNCDFYGLRDDHAQLLTFILAETGCRIFELYSSIGHEIHEFKEIDEIMTAYDDGEGQYRLLLNLYAPSMAGDFRFRRISLEQKKFGEGAFRYKAHGWGAIQLYLGGIHKERLHTSHTNHNSEKRAIAWTSPIDDLGSPEAWNWSEVNRISNRINRFARKVAVEKQGANPILPAASRWRAAGGVLA